ncbi:hypothetical protein ACOTTU_20820 [Roseobacter sp. EG26]|uniref:hypothetical protein n=1 Tax=Roseobacter sp. EG26 TaxID=3412477 RepID=UPI003CE4970C
MTNNFDGKFIFARGAEDLAGAERTTRMQIPKSRTIPGRIISTAAFLGLVFVVGACSMPQISGNAGATDHPMNDFSVPLLISY